MKTAIKKIAYPLALLTGRIVSSMPYLIRDANGKFLILYWIERFNDGIWEGSSWYTSREAILQDIDIPEVEQIWELPGLKYPKPNLFLQKVLHSAHIRTLITDPTHRHYERDKRKWLKVL